MNNNPPAPDPPSEEPPLLPGFRTWRGVYFVVLGLMAAYIALLAAWSRWFG